MSRTPGIYEGISNADYHSDNEWLSSSQIKVANASAYDYKFFVLDKKGTRKDTASKSFGSATHKLILEADTFFDEYAVIDTSAMDLRRKADKEKMEAFKASNEGKLILTKEEFDKVQQCRDSVYSHPDARRLLELPGVSEASLYVELEHVLPGGEIVLFKVRVRPDRLAYGHAILDLKTSKSAAKDSFEKDAFAPWGYQYDLSAALYTRAWEKHSGEKLPFIFIVVKNDEPWSCAVYKMKDESMKKGEAKLNRALNTIIMSERAGKWEYQEKMEEI